MINKILIFLNKKIKGNEIIIIISITFAIHLAVIFIIHSLNFQPIKITDHADYNNNALIVSEIWQNRTLDINQHIKKENNYTYIIASFYLMFGGNVILALLFFSVFLSTITAVVLYYLAREIGGQSIHAFWVSVLGTNTYLSFLYFGSFFCKENIIVPLSLVALLFGIRFLKYFKISNFILFFASSFILYIFNYEIGSILFLAFILATIFIRTINTKKRCASIVGFLLIFVISSMISGQGFFGFKELSKQLNFQHITQARETIYSKGANSSIGVKFIDFNSLSETKNTESKNPSYFSSLIHNISGYLYSLFSVILGPLPWQMFKPVYWFLLIETIPWYIVLYYGLFAIFKDIRNKRIILPIVFFAFGLLFAIALISDNMGASTRFRTPAFLAIVCLVPLALTYKNKKHEDSLHNN